MNKNKNLFIPTSEHLKKSVDNFKNEDGYNDYKEVLKALGKM